MRKVQKSRLSSESGFSIIEILVVVGIIGIMSTIAIFYATNHKKAYQPDDQALMLADMLQEARQRALTQRRTMRVEVNLATNSAVLYDENTNATTSSDDAAIKAMNLFAPTNVKVDSRPSQISYNPAELLPVPNAVFKPSVYTPSVSQSVFTIRFLANGSAVDAGTNATGAGAVPTGVTLHIWAPKKTDATQSEIARAITILGSTGVIRLWEFDPSSPAANKWKDSRRSSSYGS
ncbi:MAG: prepilin-type N-terminal cleavage/methylation domain-containing protein [Acidobacteria bacterium]|nr:prepilin-type N-terminal cleavage/methylation domain-containing protein [Acidobacteriota bacterium]